VTIPAGVDKGKRITIPGLGDTGENNGPAGDLVVVLHVGPHRYFEREGNDLYCAVPISATQAILGCDLFFTSIDEKKIKLKIPPGTAQGKMLRIPGAGVPVGSSGHRGDMYIKILLTLPEHLTDKQKHLMTEFALLEGATDSPQPVALSSLR
jgi:molecular chaperone DnaJ